MITIDITSNIERQLRGVEHFARDIPFIASKSLNSTGFEVRKQITEITYPRSFTVRNRILARRMWKVKLSRKYDLNAAVEQTLERAWVAAQAEGGAKPHRGAQIAIPVRPSDVRAPTGRVRAPLKPINITKRKGVFLMGKGVNKIRIVKRDPKTKDLTTIYTFQSGAHLNKRFPFYEDATRSAVYHFPNFFRTYMERLIIASVFE